MAKPPSLLALSLGAVLFAGCAGDDTVNPLPPPDAGTSDASKDATAGDGSSPHDGSADGKAAESTDAGDASADAPADGD